MQTGFSPFRMAWSLPELSSLLGLSLGLLRKEAKRGVLRTRRIGRRVIVLEPDLNSYLESAAQRTQVKGTGCRDES